MNKNLLLGVPRRMVVVVVEPDLSPRNHLGMPCQLLHRLVGGVVREPGFMRMDANGCVQERILFRQLNAGIERRWAVAIANRHHGPDTGFASTSDDLVAIGVELLAIEMCV